MHTNNPRTPLARLWDYAAPYRAQVIWASVWSVLNKLADIAPPFLIGMAVDIAVRRDDSFVATLGWTEPRAQLVVLAAITAAVWGTESVFEYLYGVRWRNLAQNIQHTLRRDTYAHLQRLELGYFEDRSTGDLMAVLNDDINQLERFLDRGANEVIQVVTTVLSIGAAFFAIAANIAWLAFLPIPLVLWGSFWFQRRIEPRYAAVRAQAGAINGVLANNLGGMATIKSFTAEDREVDRIVAESEAYRTANAGAIRLSSAFSPLIRVAILIGFTTTLVWGGFMTLSGNLEVGLYSVMVFLTQRLLWPLTRLGETFDLYQRAMASTRRILGVLDTQPQMIDGAQALPGAVVDTKAGAGVRTADIRGALALADVTFAYRDGHPVLRDVTARIEAGKTTAFVGPTGSGKTTIVKLLLRFYDPGQGVVTIDGVDLRQVVRRDLRRAIALVSQDVFLFDGTVADNIAYGRPDASRADIRAAAEAAEATEFIDRLPEGYDTMVGERGQKLSGGQRQRLSIARAILANSPILVLDEATSAVDNETEAAIQRSLERVSRDRTTVVIAHRLSTVRHADRIYVLDGGQIVESGTHDELVARAGTYHGLWMVQTGEAVAWHAS